MYRLPPVEEQKDASKVVEMGTTTSTMPFDPFLDADIPRKAAYKEGCFIPGQFKTSGFREVSPNDPKTMHHVLKQL